eukprot:TRINITY_DN1012_c0_g1_i14.p1 TRINITY_DN1012_c0_g1~~TRINITY_DN1012_c0_g1_i14.p1  ORF type:complete len:122 (+),score=4.84 TRINITY_DN1012_c0_g1_i14:192-557(+)
MASHAQRAISSPRHATHFCDLRDVFRSATNLEAVITVSADLFPDPSDLVCPVRASKGHRRKPSSGRLQQFPLVKRGCCHWKKPSLHALVPLVLLVLVLWTLHHSFGLYNVASWMVRVSARM